MLVSAATASVCGIGCKLITQLRIKDNVPVVVREYALLHKSKGYVLSFQSTKRDASRFVHAANSIRFTSNA